MKLLENLSAPQSIQKFEEKNHTHVGIMFNGAALEQKDQNTQLVVQTMLGGGMSFSAGGPGKGMLTKLYRECLCKYVAFHPFPSIQLNPSKNINILGKLSTSHLPHIFPLNNSSPTLPG